MVKRKQTKDDGNESNQTIPIPIQIFLWRQTSPFFRTKLGKLLCEASCVTYERVIVQNILHGLSPSLCEALQSIDRWKVIQAALPHVMHCCSVLIKNRKESSPGSKFAANEIKLLYTLHWILLDAASECEDGTGLAGGGTGDIYLGEEDVAASPEKKREKEKNLQNYLHSLETIQLFIYFFAPLFHSMRYDDFQSLKLENGLRLWQPLWEYKQPDIACFSMPVKPSRSHKKLNTNLMLNFIKKTKKIKSKTSLKDISKMELPEKCQTINITESQSAIVEVICEVCNEIIFGKHGETECNCPKQQTSNTETIFEKPIDDDKSFTKTLFAEREDVCSASYMDVAVLRCLFCSQWEEDGVYWSLKYLHNRLLEILEQQSCFESMRERSKSLPIFDLSVDILKLQENIITSPKPFQKLSLKKSVAEISSNGEINPIITITKDSPMSSEINHDWTNFKNIPLKSNSQMKTKRKLQRSLSDSSISYESTDNISEVAGSVYYTDSQGQIDYKIILKVTHIISSRDYSARVCLVLLNIVDSLLDLNAIDNKGVNYNMAMETICRIYRCLGCPHGCNESLHGTIGDRLRNHAMKSLHRLRNLNEIEFRKFFTKNFLEINLKSIMKFLHALLGFCFEKEDEKRWRKISSSGYNNNFGEQELNKDKRVDNFIVFVILKKLVSKFVECYKEIHNSENVSLYCDVRHFFCHVKETHGNTFRRVALSGLIDAIPRNIIKENIKVSNETSFPVDNKKTTTSTKFFRNKTKPLLKYTRRTVSMTSETEEISSVIYTSVDESLAYNRRNLFRKKVKHGHQYDGNSDSEILDEPRHEKLSPRVSVSGEADTDGICSGQSTPKRKFSKFALTAWKKNMNRSDDEQSDYESRRESKTSPSADSFRKSKMSFKAAGQATLTFLSARKRIEDGLKSFSKRRTSNYKRGSIDDDFLLNKDMLLNNGNSLQRESLMKEKRLVNSYAVKSGMLRFNLMLDCCIPGSVPDAHLIASILDLEAPVVSKAALLLECAHFVNKCNKGEWPNWMKRNLPQSGRRSLHVNSQLSGFKYTMLLQRNAGKLFHLWGEAIGNRLWYILLKETSDDIVNTNYVKEIKDEKIKKNLRIEDDNEDYLDEATLDETRCPYSLKMIACQLLLEITTFLRETYQHLPKVKESTINKESEDTTGLMVNSSSDRKISFAVLGRSEDRSDSIHSSNNSLSGIDQINKKTVGKKTLLKMRRGSGSGNNSSFKRSFKLKRESGSLRRLGSIRSNRKVSTQSLKSEKSDEDHYSIDEEQSFETSTIDEEVDYSKSMPWIKVVIRFANSSNFICQHDEFCQSNCYERQRRSCIRLLNAIKKIYSNSTEKLLVNKETKMLNYLQNQVQNIIQTPLSIIIKSGAILSNDNFLDILPVAWEFLLENDQELAAAAATLFILSSIKIGNHVQDMISKELQHTDKNQRINAVLRFHVLWKFRYQVWPRMEDGANMFIKLPPPSIDFVQPSPTIGIPSLSVIDPPWSPHFKSKIEQVAINDDETKSLVTATTTRRKQQQEMINRAVSAQEQRRKSARENFHVSSIAANYLAAYEPGLHHIDNSEYEESTPIVPDEVNAAAARRMSIAPVLGAPPSMISRPSAVGPASGGGTGRNSSWRHGSVLQWGRPTVFEAEDGFMIGQLQQQHMQVSQAFFPSFICSAALSIINLLDDLQIGQDGLSVSQISEKVIWYCLVEDTALFLRCFLEKLTHRDKQEELIFLLRKLLMHTQTIPAQSAHTLFNYIVGFIMFYVRSPAEGGNESIARALSFLWQLVPSVHGICFRDLKQTLRKEQCETTLLITAIVPSAKKLIVHGPDLASIPFYIPLEEETQFQTILSECLDFFDVKEDSRNRYFLMDAKTHQIHHGDAYVRDFYFFRRNMYPQLSLLNMQPKDAFQSLQINSLTLKAAELGRVLFTTAVLETHSNQQLSSSISFLHEELMKLSTFPRKALECDFSLHRGKFGKELYGLDMMHKYAWLRLLQVLFRSMSTNLASDNDLPVLFNVINAILLLYYQDTAMLRFCLSIYLNACRHFKQIFTTNSFFIIMPTILKIYSNCRITIVRQAIEFLCRSFYTLHREPFLLQMFGSCAKLLKKVVIVAKNNEKADDIESEDDDGEDKINNVCLFELLKALEDECHDVLNVMDLVDEPLPFKALDLCYENDEDVFKIIFAINTCTTVIAYAPDSIRSLEMLRVLHVLLPNYLCWLAKESDKTDNIVVAKEEFAIISQLIISVKALVLSCESLGRNFSMPQRHLESNVKSTTENHHHNNNTYDTPTNFKNSKRRKKSKTNRPSIYPDEISDIRFTTVVSLMEEGRSSSTAAPNMPIRAGENELAKTMYCFLKPRNSLLSTVTNFYKHCHIRFKKLRCLIGDNNFRVPAQLLDTKMHNRIADIVQTLLKIAPYSPATIACFGLENYIINIFPIIDWSLESNRPALNLTLKRLERLFFKISKQKKKSTVNWLAIDKFLTGLFKTLKHFKYVAFVGNLRNIINSCINIILTYDCPSYFSSTVIKLTSAQMQILGEQFNLSQICGNITTISNNQEKTINLLINLILPLCLSTSNTSRCSPKMNSNDISFVLSLLLHALAPPSATINAAVGDLTRTAALANNTQSTINLEIIFLGLRIVIVSFEKQLSMHWFQIARTISAIFVRTTNIALSLWKFLDFIFSYKTPLTILLQPFIRYKISEIVSETEEERLFQQLITEKIQCGYFIMRKSRGKILYEMSIQLKQMKSDVINSFDSRPRTATLVSENSKKSVIFQDKQKRIEIPDGTPLIPTISNKSIESIPALTTCSAFKRKSMQKINAKNGVEILNEIEGKDNVSPQETEQITHKLLHRADVKTRNTFKFKRQNRSATFKTTFVYPNNMPITELTRSSSSRLKKITSNPNESCEESSAFLKPEMRKERNNIIDDDDDDDDDDEEDDEDNEDKLLLYFKNQEI